MGGVLSLGRRTASNGQDIAPSPFVTARRTLPFGRPIALLTALEGGPRGFWARGSRWVAHGGVLGEFRVSADDDRIRRIEAWGRRWEPFRGDEDALRFYGGFSFRTDHLAEGEWRAFPAARFHLPTVEYDGEGIGEARLRVRAAVDPDEDLEAARERAEREADRLVAILEVAPATGSQAATGRVAAREIRTGERAVWLDAVEETLRAIRRGGISKAVLARTLDVALAAQVSPVAVVDALWNQHVATHAFLFEPEPGALLLGAAPEALATLRDGRVTATAVAGSIRRGAGPDEDARLGEALLASRKDRAEHRVVVEDMVARMEALTGPVSAQDEPHVLTLARIQHLETEIEAPARPGLSVLDLVEALHPTPAVCGMPRDAALAFLREAEPFHRGWYAGPVGWFDTDGEGHFVPALRTAVANGCDWRLYAGAGVVEGSDPAAEWDETAIKFGPVLRALEASGADLGGASP